MGAQVKRLVVIGVGAVILAACSSGGDAAPSTLPPSTSTTVGSTVPATTVVGSTTTSSSTTTSTTSTTLAPPTTVTSTEDLIKQAVQDYFVAYEACGQAPDQCDPSSFTAAKGSIRSTIGQLVAGMIDEGLRFSTDDRGSYLLDESIEMVSGDEATATYCAHDALIVLGPVGPDGQPTIVNDQIEEIRYQYRVFREGSEWRVGLQHELEHLPEGVSCPSTS
jgi:hypothetical protein